MGGDLFFFYHCGYAGRWFTVELAEILGIVQDLSVFTYKSLYLEQGGGLCESAGPLSGFGWGLVLLSAECFILINNSVLVCSVLILPVEDKQASKGKLHYS